MAIGLADFGLSLLNSAFGVRRQEMNNDFASDESQRNREFQERMSNTSYQRAMADMEKAGLNPMLAYSQGGASLPTGSTASPVSFGNADFTQSLYASSAARAAEADADTKGDFANAANVNAMASAEQAATAAKDQRKRGSLIDAQVDKIESEIQSLKTERDKADALIKLLGQHYLNAVQENVNQVEINSQIKAIVNKLKAEIPLLKSQQFLNTMSGQLASARTKLTDEQTRSARVDANASESFGEIGATTGKLRPFLELLWNVFKR